MHADAKKESPLEIGHVLFIDIVGYSKLLINEQREALQTLNEIVRATAQVCAAEASKQLIRLPSGDGVALVFRNSPEAPAHCAVEISRALKKHAEFAVRMGINSGPVSEIVDVNERANIAGGGINIAQRVMDCGDAGHILLSKRVAEDLAQSREWQPYLFDLGECEVKHGVKIQVFNLFTGEEGREDLPQKLQDAHRRDAVLGRTVTRRKTILLGVGALIVAAAIAGVWWLRFGAQQSAGNAAGVSDGKSIAVLPFENFSDEKQNAFFADGVQDEILTRLAKIADLKVISRTSVMQYRGGAGRNLREIGRQLGVTRLLEGSVQRAGTKVRVNAQLIDATNDAHLWAQSYTRDLADVFAIQSELAGDIAEQLRVKLSAREKAAMAEQPTKNVEAFERYSRAKTILATGLTTAQEKSFLQAAELLDSAVAQDPSFYAAFVQLVFVNDSLYSGYDHTPERLATAESALARAVQLRPDAPETHLARGQHLYYALRDYGAALAELGIASRGLPNDARILETTGYILRRQGKHEEGLHALQQAIALDPRNTFMLAQIALSDQLLRRYNDEAAVLTRVLEITPDDASVESSRAALPLLARADPRPLRQFIEKVRKERPAALGDIASDWLICAFAEGNIGEAEQAVAALGDNLFVNDWSVRLTRQFAEGLLGRAMHDDGRARMAFTAARVEQAQIVEKQSDYGPALIVLGLIDAALGNKEAALAEGRRAMELLPIEKDPSGGQRLIAYFAMLAAWVGEKDLALEQLAIAAPTPGGSTIASYGILKLTPFWEPLHGDPRFEKIAASLAPKE